MTVQTTALRGDYTGNGVTTIFAVPFYFLENSHVQIEKLDTLTNTTTTLALTTDYTLAGAGVGTGGTATLLVAPLSTDKIAITRNVPYTQQTHYVEGDPFPSQSHEAALDKLTMLAQQLGEESARSVKAPASAAGFDGELPNMLPSYLVATNAAGTGFELVAPSSGTAADLAIDLLDTASSVKGAGMVGYDGTHNYEPDTVGDHLNSISASSGSSLVGFIQSVTGAVARTVQDKLVEVVSIKDFGAKGDGVADDTAALQVARDYAASATYPIKIKFPAGKYLYSASPNWAIHNLILESEGIVILQYTGTGDAFICDADVFGAGGGRSGITVGRFIIFAPSTAGCGALIRSIHHSHFELTVKGCGVGAWGTAIGINVLGCVCTTFYNPVVNKYDIFNGWHSSSPPDEGMRFGSSSSYGHSNSCLVINPIMEFTSAYGIHIAAADCIRILGGTCEQIGPQAGGTASFATNVMTLVSGSVAIGDCVSASGLKLGTIILALASGTLNAPGSTYTLSTSPGTLAERAFITNRGIGLIVDYGCYGVSVDGVDFEENAIDVSLGGNAATITNIASSAVVEFTNGSATNVLTGGSVNAVKFRTGSVNNVIDNITVNNQGNSVWLADEAELGRNHIGKCIDNTTGAIGVPYAKKVASTGAPNITLANTTRNNMLVYVDDTHHKNSVQLIAPDASSTYGALAPTIVPPGFSVNVQFISAGGGDLYYSYL